MKLYQNEISSATCRVCIAPALKGIEVQTQRVGILGADADNRQPDYLRLNPQGLVPLDLEERAFARAAPRT